MAYRRAKERTGVAGGDERRTSWRLSPFLPGPDSRNRHKSRRFIICVGRYAEDTIGCEELAGEELREGEEEEEEGGRRWRKKKMRSG